MSEIKITQDQLRIMSVFEHKTHVSARDCVDDEKHNRLLFIVDEGKVGAAIGKGGVLIKAAQHAMKRDIEIVEYSEDPAQFLTNVLGPKLVGKVKINKRDNGAISATVMVDPSKKALVIGREGRNVTKARILAQRHFGISSITIENTEQAVQGL